MIAMLCAEAGNGGTTEEGCLAGVYRHEGTRWTRVIGLAALDLATQGDRIVVMAQGNVAAGSPYGQVDLRLSSDGGLHWAPVNNPCDLLALGTSSASFDAAQRLEVLCELDGPNLSAKRQLQQAVNDPPTTWKTNPPLPDQGTSMHLDLTLDGHGIAWGDRSPLLTTSDRGSSWTAHLDVADGVGRFVEDASAYTGGGWAAIVGDPARQADVLLLSTDGSSWREVSVYPG